jgi:hypothetical protein
MKKSYPQQQLPNALEVLRKAGYSYFKDPQSHEESFVLRLTSEFYPRFHLYVIQTNNETTLNLHLDQKKPSYGEETKHSGEYEGPAIEKEMRRIDGWVQSLSRPPEPKPGDDVDIKQKQQQKHLGQKLKEWWQGLSKE